MSKFLMSFRVKMHNINIIAITISSIAMMSCISIYIFAFYIFSSLL